MGKALEIIHGRVVAPSTTMTAWTMASGNSLTIRNAPLVSIPLLLSMWALQQTAGTLRVRSPKLHDNVQGLRYRIPVNDPSPIFPYGYSQMLSPQDTLTAEQSGSATAGDIEQGCLLVYYPDLPGSDARLFKLADILPRIKNLVTVENSITGGVGGGYSGEVALNATFDLLKANTDYALLGFTVDVKCACVRWRGADTGNLGLGGPGGPALRFLTCEWFVELARYFDLPLIPVINSANRAGVLVDVACDENGGTFVVSSILAELTAGAAAAGAR
jgi:hypothetical protein